MSTVAEIGEKITKLEGEKDAIIEANPNWASDADIRAAIAIINNRIAYWEKRRDEAAAAVTAAAALAQSSAASGDEMGVVVQSKVSASFFNSDHHFAHIGMPLGPECFYPPREYLSTLVQHVASLRDRASDEDIKDVLKICNHIKVYRSGPTFVPPPSPEENFCRLNLDELMAGLLELSESAKGRFEKVAANEASSKVHPRLAKGGTNPEPLIVYKTDHRSAGLIGSEAKALVASLQVAMAQGVEAAAECALDLVSKFGDKLNQENVIVPFILTSWETFQFGCVYLIPECYPCAVLLSGALLVSSPSDRMEISRWVVALAAHCKRMASVFENSGGDDASASIVAADQVESASSQPVKKQRVVTWDKKMQSGLLSGRYLFKTVLVARDLARAVTAHIMSVFYRLAAMESEHLDTVCFPAGVIGLPSQKHQLKLYLVVWKCMKSFPNREDWLKSYWVDILEEGHPIILYERLDAGQWTVSQGNIENQSEPIRRAYLKALEAALTAFSGAGVVHMDVRLPNVFYQVISENEVKVKVIDWDDALLLGDEIPDDLKDKLNNHPGFPRNHGYACAECHTVQLEVIKTQLGLGDETM